MTAAISITALTTSGSVSLNGINITYDLYTSPTTGVTREGPFVAFDYVFHGTNSDPNAYGIVEQDLLFDLGGYQTITVPFFFIELSPNVPGTSVADPTYSIHGLIPSYLDFQQFFTPEGPIGVYFANDFAEGTITGDLSNSAGVQFIGPPFPYPATPFMSDAIKNSNNTTLIGLSEANSTVSVFDGNKLIGTVTADNLGNWSLQTDIKANTVHKFTETWTDVDGNTGHSAGVTLYAPNANKILIGGSGNDFLIAGHNDTLTGGGGRDTFVFNPGFGNNTITDFNVSQDVLRFDHTLFAKTTASQVLSQTHDDSKGDAIIVVHHGDTVTLIGVTVAQLQSHLGDFTFF
jgi:hypothetical protein